MQADAIIAVLKRWVEVLAMLLLGWREHRRSQRITMISEENGELLVRQAGPDKGADAKSRSKVLSAATAKGGARPLCDPYACRRQDRDAPSERSCPGARVPERDRAQPDRPPVALARRRSDVRVCHRQKRR